MDPPLPSPRGRVIGIVGPCSAGKTTLVQNLARRGFHVKAIGQEHSYVPYMWQAIGHADVLIFLDVSYAVAQARRRLDWLPADLDEQHHRLRHARAHCDFFLDTDPLTPEQVCDQAAAFLIQGS
jgi:nicotinamide riboside kinase